jgi:predicted DCC family thiol-disulfide oxidoreductase YuxK
MLIGENEPPDMNDSPIILFDAECVLCSANAQFVLKHDKAGHFRLASMQGDVGAALYRAHGMDPRDPMSMIVVEGSRVRQDSDAVLSIYEALGFPWRMFGVFRIVPAFARDPVYRWIARNRYRLFGKRSSCWIAPPEFRSRIL